MINLMHSYGQVRHVRAGISQAHARGRREPLARALTRELHEETGLVITAAHAGRLGGSGPVACQYAGARLCGARLERKVLRWWHQRGRPERRDGPK